MGHPRWRFTASLFVAALAVPAALAGGGLTSSASSSAAKAPTHIDCSNSARFLCTEVRDSDKVFGHYVGHDEPSVLFYSNANGSGNEMQYSGSLPKEPSATNVPGKHGTPSRLPRPSGSGWQCVTRSRIRSS